MTKEVKLPELGENIDKAIVGTLLVARGDQVQKDQPILEVETDKAIAEVPSPYQGIVKQVHVKQGEEIEVGRTLLTLETTRDSEPPPREDKQTPELETDERKAPFSSPSPEKVATDKKENPPPSSIPPQEPGSSLSPTSPEPGPKQIPVPASPSIRRLARELGVDLGQVSGSGPGGRISAEDVKDRARLLLDPQKSQGARAAAQDAQPELPDFGQWGPVRKEPMSSLRRATAAHLSRSWSLVPQVTQFDEADITDVEDLRIRWSKKADPLGGKLTVTAILIKIVASALKVFPQFNASLDLSRQEIIYKQYIHIGVAVDAGHGLLVPVIRNANQKNILQLSADLTQLSRKARSKSLGLEEMRGASFTVTNLGGLGTTHFSPLVNWPEAAILGIGRASHRAVHVEGGKGRDGRFVPRLILPLSLSYDHRLIDGADAARFLRWTVEALEQPLKIALEG